MDSLPAPPAPVRTKSEGEEQAPARQYSREEAVQLVRNAMADPRKVRVIRSVYSASAPSSLHRAFCDILPK